MKRGAHIIVLLSLLCFVGTTVAPKDGCSQEVLQVSIEEAVALALRKSEDFQIAANELDKMQYRYKEARSAIYPHIEGQITWAHNPEYPDVAAATTKDYSLDTGVTVNQVLWAFGRVSSAIRLADKYITISRFNKDITKQEIVYNTKLSYYSALLAERTLSIVQSSYENVRKNKTLLEKRASAGRSSKRDNIKMAADIASRVPRVNDAQAAFDSAMKTLKTILGVDTAVSIKLTEDFAAHYNTVHQEETRESLHENEPTLQALRKQVDADEDMIKLKRANFLPTLSAFATWNYRGIGDTYEVRRDNLDHYVVAGLKVSIPIWLGGETGAQLSQAKIDKEIDILRLHKTTKEFVLELDNAISEYHAYINTLEANRKAVELAKESFKMAQDLFESGQVSLADLNDAELLLTNEKLSMVLTLYNLNNTLATIEKLSVMELRK
jgi:outer membrane protein TolC